MSNIQVQLRRGTTSQHNSFAGAVGEVTVDTDLDTLRVHDGSTNGGVRLAKHSELAGAGGGGTVTSVDSGTGLTGGPITTSGTLSISSGGVGTTQLADNAVTSAKISDTDSQFLVDDTSTQKTVVINEGGADVDFRVEGDTDTNLIVTEASSDKVGIKGAVGSISDVTIHGGAEFKDGSIQISRDSAIPGIRLQETTTLSSPDQQTDINLRTQDGALAFAKPQKSTNKTTHLFYPNGDTQSLTGSYGTISDRNLKENINYLSDEQKTGQVEDIKNLKFAKFNLKGEELTQLGVIAQDVEQTSPGLVSKSIIDGSEIRSVKQSIIHQKAVVALQVALQKIEDLEARIKVLESK